MAVWSFMFLLAGLYPGAVGQTVKYPPPVCAVRESTVTLPCTFTPLRSFNKDGREVFLQIIRVRWCRNHLICQGTTPSVYDSDSENNNPRYQYLGDKKGNCTLRITGVQGGDSAKFRFRMEANDSAGHFTGQSGVDVTVIDGSGMKIISSSRDGAMTEGQTVTLHCSSICTFHQLEVTWFRGDHALPESGSALRLGPLTAKDSGNYTCALKTKPKTRSRPYTLHVAAKEEEVVKAHLIAGVVLGVLLALCALTLLLFIIRRKRRAASEDHRAVGGELEQKHDNIYSNILLPAEGGVHAQETSPAEDVSYVSIQFKHKNRPRPVEETDDSVIYSSVANRG